MPDSLSILVKAKQQHRETAVSEKGKLVEYYAEHEDETSLVGAIFLGVVENVVPAMKAAFINIGQKQNGFLPLQEMQSFTEQGKGETLVSGREVLVQVKKDARDEKGAYLTRDIALPGQHLIYMPMNQYIGVSKRVQSESDREKLVQQGKELSGGNFGLIMRYGALHARYEAVQAEVSEMAEHWEALEAKVKHAKPPAMLYREPSALAALIRDYSPRYRINVTCNDAVNRMPSPPVGLMWEQLNGVEMEAAWHAAHVQEQLQEALNRTVPLPGGGSLVIDQREALTTIDVNSGKFISHSDRPLALRQNLLACAPIARQIRLRNLGGIILIDFIDMAEEDERMQVIALLEAELARERGKNVLHGFTSLGLLEMTRKRTGLSLRDMVQAPCKVCGGTGYTMGREQET